MDLFESNIELVSRVVNRMNYSFTNKDDLMQVGLMGLFQACKNYKEEMNVKFNTYATYYIIGEIKKELRENKLIKLNKKLYKIIKIIKENEYLSVDEISKTFAISKEDIILGYQYMNNVTSLDKDNDDNELNLLNLIPDLSNNKSIIYDAFDCLGDIERNIITLKYFNNYSQSEIGKKLSINQTKVSRIEKVALAKMRKNLLSK